MVYLSGGKVVERKSFLSLEGLIDLFWSFINFCVLFVRTLINPNSSGKYETNYRQTGKADRGRKIGGFNRGGGGGGGEGGGGSSPGPPPMGGG